MSGSGGLRGFAGRDKRVELVDVELVIRPDLKPGAEILLYVELVAPVIIGKLFV
jgi:hypothetical protein